LLRSRISPRRYAVSAINDARTALARVARDRAALVATILFLLPWWSLVFIRQDDGWLASFAEIVVFVFAFWWMSRSGSAEPALIKRPMLESILAIALVLLWVEWRTGICDNLFPFLPSGFNCFDNVGYEIVPKIAEGVVFPFAVLWATGYRWRAQGIHWSWRAWWIALPLLLGTAAYGIYLHQPKPLEFGQGTVTYFFAAGLPEEYLFRALLLTRLEAWWKSKGWALFGAAAIFGLSHLAIDYLVFTKRDWRETWITALTFQMGFGYAFAFAYQRTRNIWPIAVLHAMVDAL
jgi:membrane protease YdiL (CAAX protease family)